MSRPRREDAKGPDGHFRFARGGSDESGHDLVGLEEVILRRVRVGHVRGDCGHIEARRCRTSDVVTKATQGSTVVGTHRGSGEDLDACEADGAAGSVL